MHSETNYVFSFGKDDILPDSALPFFERKTLRQVVDNFPRLPRNTPEGFRIYLLKKMFTDRFVESSDSAELLRDRAIAKMLDSEARCAILNKEGHSVPLVIMARAREIVYRILGDFDIETCMLRPKFSNGASTCHRRSRGHAMYKYNDEIEVTNAAYPYLYTAISLCRPWAAEGGLHRIKLAAGNRVTTVPKDEEKDRCIAIEPAGNNHLQLAVGGYIRHRLKAVANIDLDDQSRNRYLARVGSISTLLSTIDLSSASDTISIEIVKSLLPIKWFEVLSDLRSVYGVVNSKLHRWEKFSSMGNGFTFELETLIFYALVLSVCGLDLADPNVSVYGDDIICPTKHFDAVSSTLVQAGFSVNEKKSFSHGFFRESCGGFYYKGVDVWPIRPKGRIDKLSTAMIFLNQVARWSHCEITGQPSPYWADWWKSLLKKNPWLRLFMGCPFDGPSGIMSKGCQRLSMRPRKERLSAVRYSAGAYIARLQLYWSGPSGGSGGGARFKCHRLSRNLTVSTPYQFFNWYG